jgi:hypothetical protein
MNVEPHHYLRTEGLVVAAVALATYFTLDGSLWLLAVLALAPDVSTLGYVAGQRVGALVYNTAHTYALPLALGAVGLITDFRLALLVALVWMAHIGADRALGYGLKYESGFKNTHLSSQPVPSSLLKRW